jgi:hypothetical protein
MISKPVCPQCLNARKLVLARVALSDFSIDVLTVWPL